MIDRFFWYGGCGFSDSVAVCSVRGWPLAAGRQGRPRLATAATLNALMPHVRCGAIAVSTCSRAGARRGAGRLAVAGKAEAEVSSGVGEGGQERKTSRSTGREPATAESRLSTAKKYCTIVPTIL